MRRALILSLLLLSSAVHAELYPQDLNAIITSLNSVQGLQSAGNSSLASLVTTLNALKSLVSSLDDSVTDFIKADVRSIKNYVDNINGYMSSFLSDLNVLPSVNSYLSSIASYSGYLSYLNSLSGISEYTYSLDSNFSDYVEEVQPIIDLMNDLAEYENEWGEIHSLLDWSNENNPLTYDILSYLSDYLGDLDLEYVGSSNLSPDLTEIWDNYYGDYSVSGLAEYLMSSLYELRYLTADVNYNLSNIGTCFSPLSPYGDGLSFLGSSFDHEYASIGFASNSTPTEVSLEYDEMDFFHATIKLLSDGNKVNAATTYFLKHINDKMPKAKDTSEDESRIQSKIASASDVKDSLDSAFTFTTVEFRDIDDYFDSTTLLGEFDGAELPVSLSFTFPSFGGFGAQTFTVYTDSLVPFLNVSRAVFTLLYFVLLAGFVLYLFRVFFPLLVRFSTLLRSVLNW